MGRRTSPGARVAKHMDHKGLKQLQLLTGPNMSRILYSPCLVATLRRAGDDAIAKVDTRPKWEVWDLPSIASHCSSRKFGHHGEGSKRRGAKEDGGWPRKLRHSNHPSPCNVWHAMFKHTYPPRPKGNERHLLSWFVGIFSLTSFPTTYELPCWGYLSPTIMEKEDDPICLYCKGWDE